MTTFSFGVLILILSMNRLLLQLSQTLGGVHAIYKIFEEPTYSRNTYQLFDTDSDQNGMLEEIRRSGTDSLPL
jgi:hypothetical protein